MDKEPNFWQRCLEYAVYNNVAHMMEQVTPDEFLHIFKNNPRAGMLRAIPKYWVWTPEATYYWPRPIKDVKIVWYWERIY